MTIFPLPKEMTLQGGSCPASAPVNHVTDPSLGREEYRIQISSAGAELVSSCPEGAFRAQTTFSQIQAQHPDSLPCLTLHDWPDYPTRALYHYVGARVPTMEAFKKQIDMFALMKINHLEIELGSGNFNYPSFPSMQHGQNPFTVEELTELAQYAKERFIDLVPVMQTFGHIPDWLANPEYADLAECPDGFEQWGRHNPPMTLNPLDPRSQQLVRKRLDDVLPIFKGCGQFNIGCDETWELGMGKSREACEKLGRTRVFLNFVTQTIEYLTAHGVKPLFWADIILQGGQEVLDAMPKESVALNWGYERGEVSEDSCRRLQKTGVPYWNCPGTSVWASLLGQSYKAVQNIARCAVLGKRYGASGLLNTDWGDHNLHHFSPAYFGVAYAAAMGWSVAEADWQPLVGEDRLQAIAEPDAAQLAKTSPTAAACFAFLNRFVYQDSRCRMAQLAYDAGQYGQLSRHPGIHNSTQVKRILVDDPDQLEVYGYEAQDFMDTKAYLDVILYRLSHEPHMACADAQWILDEYRDSVEMLRYGCDVALYRLGCLQGYDKAGYQAMMRSRRDDILREHNRVWRLRNREHDNGAARFFRQFDLL